MKLEQSFEVAAPLERVWEALIDVERVAPCLPGAAITGRNDDGSYNGTFKVKIGPTSASYSGNLTMENVDESAHTATMQAQGTDKRGQGGAKASIIASLSDTGGGATRVDVVTEYRITGRLARFGRGGMIDEISEQLLGDFSHCLTTTLAGDGGQEPAATEPAVSRPEELAVTAPAVSRREDAAVTEPAVGLEEPAVSRPPAQEPVAATPARPVGPQSEPGRGLSEVLSVLWGQAKSNPIQAVAALVFGFLLAPRLFRRRD
jgi:carbon monoxide dehydrogenase subunit G